MNRSVFAFSKSSVMKTSLSACKSARTYGFLSKEGEGWVPHSVSFKIGNIDKCEVR